ncbi:MAG: roadblock/LC7 domain-containing protein [Candidatus Zixiibacteriota bacterium]|nr:MAG: roadblock/LC7 domain-containing protein [candidate division Zixibacteria bacterium]
MYQILDELNKTSGITGSMVVGNDGIVIASDLDTSLEEEAVGALAASITGNIQKSLDRMQQTPLKQITIEADTGKLFLTDAGIGILVVTAERDVNIGLIRLEIKNAISRIGNNN